MAEDESRALRAYVQGGSMRLVSSRLAVVEVTRAVRIANPGQDAFRAVKQLLAGLVLLDISTAVIRQAAALASAQLGTLDAIHLASALAISPTEMIVYDSRLSAAAAQNGLTFSSPA
jgi:predicted nucleic acid-binding protein